jgi:pSer/pThr/pTyr-binding forkhead associated (FHA) protein
MIICRNCQHENPDGRTKCEQCGTTLWTDETWEVDVNSIPISDETVIQKLPEGFSKAQIKSGWGTSTFEPTNYVILHITGAAEPIFIKPSEEYLLGRYEDINGLNLAPYGALERGVSRVHAALRRGDEMLYLVDLGSTNGTFLNEQALTPNQPRILRSGDQIRLGQFVMHIYFSGRE